MNELIEQLVDAWMGRKTYSNDQEWLEEVGCVIGELAEHVGCGSKETVEKVP